MLNEKNLRVLNFLIKFFLPFFIAAVGIFTLRTYFILSHQEEHLAKLLLLMFAYFIPPLGKESVIPIGVAGGNLSIPLINKSVFVPSISPFIMAVSIAFVDIVVALFLVWNYDLAKKIPLVGDFMRKVESIGQRSSSKYSWMKPLRFLGIVLFVMVPFQGSGGLVGSIVGRLIGMKPVNTFLAISTGAIIGCTIIAYFADALRQVFIQNLLIGALVVILVVVISFMVLVYRKQFEIKGK